MVKQSTISTYFKDKNFMTPDVIEYGTVKGRTFYELSEGQGFDGQPIYGVSVVTKEHGRIPIYEHEQSNVFQSLEDARRHIRNLRITAKELWT